MKVLIAHVVTCVTCFWKHRDNIMCVCEALWKPSILPLNSSTVTLQALLGNAIVGGAVGRNKKGRKGLCGAGRREEGDEVSTPSH